MIDDSSDGGFAAVSEGFCGVRQGPLCLNRCHCLSSRREGGRIAGREKLEGGKCRDRQDGGGDKHFDERETASFPTTKCACAVPPRRARRPATLGVTGLLRSIGAQNCHDGWHESGESSQGLLVVDISRLSNATSRALGGNRGKRRSACRVYAFAAANMVVARTARTGEDATSGMPRILLRHIIAELLRVQILTASVLVAVIAFGAAIRPIMQNLLGAEEVLQFVTLASVPMLQYALPFAGAFAGTIVYARLAADNEIVAMSAAGLSYRRILMPAAALGLVLFLGMALLVDAGVPRFWTSMRRLITRDVTRLFVSSVERGEAYRVGNTQLYADEVMVIPGEEVAGQGGDGTLQRGPSTRLALAGVAAIETGPDGRTQTEFTAEFATVDVYRTEESAFLKLLFRNATAFRDGEDALVYVPQAEPEAIDLGKGIQLEPKDLDSAGLLRVWNDVGGYHRVAEARREATSALTAVDAWTCITKSLAETGTARFADAGGIRIYEVKNAQLMKRAAIAVLIAEQHALDLHIAAERRGQRIEARALLRLRLDHQHRRIGEELSREDRELALVRTDVEHAGEREAALLQHVQHVGLRRFRVTRAKPFERAVGHDDRRCKLAAFDERALQRCVGIRVVGIALQHASRQLLGLREVAARERCVRERHGLFATIARSHVDRGQRRL